MGLIQQLKDRYKGHKERRFLKAHGCTTWRQYERKHDPDVGYLARWAHTFYFGYPYVFPLSPTGYVNFGMHGSLPYVEASDKMAIWCEQNCQGKWRNEWLRGIWDHQGNYEFNEIGGGDTMFFAFKEEADYIWFKLTWQ